MLIHIGYDINLEFTQPTPVVLLLDVHPHRAGDLLHEEPLEIARVEIERGFDHYGNRIQRFTAPSGIVPLHYRAVIKDSGQREVPDWRARQVEVADMPDTCLHYLSGSRYCETDALTQTAWQLFGNTRPGYARVQAICDFVHAHLRFDYGTARSTRTAFEAYQEQRGVCRDFAHLAIVFCRCLNIPARYVNGYLGDIGVPKDPAPMDFSAWFEAYLDHRWITFDARHNHPRTGRVVISRARDAADTAMITTYGTHRLGTFHVVCEEMAPDSAAMGLNTVAA